MRSIPSAPRTAPPPTTARRSNHTLRRLGRALLGLLALIVVLAASGALYQAIGTALDRRAFAPAGRLVDVGGYQLHLHCVGQGSPTVVLDAGNGAPTASWAWVQPELAKGTRVCAYDRAGIGWSEAGPHPRDAGSVAQELHLLLRQAGEGGPFVLVGHSLGGQYALMFAERYPEETAGLALIDAQHPDTLFRIPEVQAAYRQQQQADMFVILSRLGFIRLFDVAQADPRLPLEAQAAMNRAKNTTALVLAFRAEQLAIPTSREQLQASGDLGNLPLAVVSATEHGMSAELEAYTMGLQRELAALSTSSRHTVVAGADHSSLVTAQHDAQTTVAAILGVVDTARARAK